MVFCKEHGGFLGFLGFLGFASGWWYSKGGNCMDVAASLSRSVFVLGDLWGWQIARVIAHKAKQNSPRFR